MAERKKICPIKPTTSYCLEKQCAWYSEDNGKCAIALLPDTLDWMVRIAITAPYGKVGDDG